MDFQPAHVVVFVRDPLLGRLVSGSSHGNGQSGSTVLPLSGVLQQVVGSRTSCSLEVGDVAGDDPVRCYLPMDSVPEKTVLCCDCVCGSKYQDWVLAVYAVLLDGKAAECDPQLSYMSLVSNMLAATLERLSKEAREVNRREQLDRLARSHSSPNQTISGLCDLLKDYTGAEATAFFTLKSNNELLLQMYDGENIDGNATNVYPVNNSPYGLSVLQGTVSVVDNVAQFPLKTVSVADCSKPSSILCLPLLDGDSDRREIVAVLCAFHYQCSLKFSDEDVEHAHWLVKYGSPVFILSTVLESEKQAKLNNQALLCVAENLFSHLDDMPMLLSRIMTHAMMLTNAEKCSVFMIERNHITGKQELVALVFDSAVTHKKNIRLSLSQGICGDVARTGKLRNISDAYKDPSFNKDIDISTGYRTRSILCFPIKNKKGIVGVAQLCNKNKGQSEFTRMDEELAHAFSVYCGISICHSVLYNRAVVAQNRSRLSAELMLYHMQVPEDDVDAMVRHTVWQPADISPTFTSFKYICSGMTDSETIQVVICMYEDMGLINQWRIPKDILCRFILMVKKGYRRPAYHNWDHALAVAHFCYCLWKRCNNLAPLDELEVLGLFVASLCHDIDHRGTNNAFQVNAHSVLAALYSSEGSVMEHHHFAQTLCILNNEGCNIFCNLSPEEYHRVLDIIREVILDTDIALHLRKVDQMKAMAEEGVDGSKLEHRSLLLSLLMTASDLNSSSKSWEDAQMLAERIYIEFFSQGDLERVMQMKPVEMMDRNKACIPEQQINFTDFIAMPVFKLLAQIYPQTSNVLARVKRNYDRWVKVKEKYWQEGALQVESPESVDDRISFSGSSADTPRSSTASIDDRRAAARTLSSSSAASWTSTASHRYSTGSLLREDSLGASYQRASTGSIDVPRRMRLRVYETFFSQRASHTVGANYTLQASRLQAARSSQQSLDYALGAPEILSGGMDPASHFDRVTDQYELDLVSQMSSLSGEIDRTPLVQAMTKTENDVPSTASPHLTGHVPELRRRQGVSGSPGASFSPM